MEDLAFNEDEITADISRELSAINLNVDELKEDFQEQSDSVGQETDEKPMQTETKFLKELESRMSSQRKAFDNQLKDCITLLHSAEGNFTGTLNIKKYPFYLLSSMLC